MRAPFLRVVTLLPIFVACSADGPKPPPATPSSGDAGGSMQGDASSEARDERDASHDMARADAGPWLAASSFAVGTVRIEIEAAGDRVLPVQLWYPATESARAEAEAGRPVAQFEPEGALRDQLAALIEAAPEGCTSRLMHAADAPPVAKASEPFPLLVFSHCMECLRFSSFAIAEHLATLGFVVAAPDHVDNTLYDQLDDTSVGLTAEFLQTRAADVKSVIDVLLDDSATVLPEDLRGKLDAERIGVFGHSYGSVTTGLVMQTDPRVKAGVMIAAPPENPLLGGVSIAEITQPALFLLAQEDNSITELGNLTLRNNFDSFPNPAWLVEVIDAGHWSFSNLCAIVDEFKPGCGMGTRQTNPLASFTYLDIELARTIAKTYIAAFFESELRADVKARASLDLAQPSDVVVLKKHD